MAFASNYAADESFVDFNNSLEFDGRGFFNCSPDAVAEIPSCSVGNAEGPLHLFSRDTFLGFHHHAGREEPFGERQMTVVEDGSSGHGEPEVAVATIQLVPGADSSAYSCINFTWIICIGGLL